MESGVDWNDAKSGTLTYKRRWHNTTEVLPTDFTWNGRPLVVIDPEFDDDMDSLCKALVEAMHRAGDQRSASIGVHPATMQAALRSLINPPRPEEPTGLGAVVEDEQGHHWVRVACSGPLDVDSPPWRHRGHSARHWARVTAIKVLSEGVTP